MKNLILFLISVFMVSACSTTLPAVDPSETLVDKADAIYILTNDEPEDAYRRIAQIITDHGYTIENSDPTLLIFNTEYKMDSIAGGMMSFSMNINVSVRNEDNNDSIIKLTAKWSRNGSTPKKIYNDGSKLDVRTKGWETLTSIAESYQNTTIEYSRNI